MALLFNPSELGVWELIYSRKLVGIEPPRGVRVPYIEPVEIPHVLTNRILLIGTFSLEAKPNWSQAGYLIQEVENVQINDAILFEGLPNQSSTTIDASNHFIGLNRIQLIVLPKFSNNFSLRFETVAWLKKITLSIWEYQGQELDSFENSLQAIKIKLEALELKIDNLR